MLLQVRNLTRSFRSPESRSTAARVQVLGPIDLQVDTGDRIALTGPNGSGKSTLLRCLAGTLGPTTGTITIAGHPAGSQDAKRLIGVSFSQERSFYLRLTGMQNLLTFARLRLPARQAKAAVNAVVAELELQQIAARRVDRCSTGMTQQLAIARALLGDPRVLLLDEPTRSLDEDAIERLWRAVDARPDCALLIATHRTEDWARCEHRIALSRN